MVFKISLILCAVGLASSFPANPPQYRPQPPNPTHYQPIESSPPQFQPREHSGYEKPQERINYVKHEKVAARPYKFDYGVRDDYTGANFGHQEESNGNDIRGSYTVLLPDGRTQTVTYVADHVNGFQAKVTYEGEAIYDEPSYEQPEPQYKPQSQRQYKPQPSYKSQSQHQPQYESQQQPQYESQHQPQYESQPRYKSAIPTAQYRSETHDDRQFFSPENEDTFTPLQLLSSIQYTEEPEETIVHNA